MRCSHSSRLSPTTGSIFFLMTPRPPRSTLFPYTTLFRSTRRRRHAHVSRLALLRRRTAAGRRRRRVDRKSTRLNSSHSSISYAVFCLKKKIITYYVLISKKYSDVSHNVLYIQDSLNTFTG